MPSPFPYCEPDDNVRFWLGVLPDVVVYATLYRGLVLNQGIQRSILFEIIPYIGGVGRVLIFQFSHPLPRDPYYECRNLVVALDEESMRMLFEQLFSGRRLLVPHMLSFHWLIVSESHMAIIGAFGSSSQGSSSCVGLCHNHFLIR